MIAESSTCLACPSSLQHRAVYRRVNRRADTLIPCQSTGCRLVVNFSEKIEHSTERDMAYTRTVAFFYIDIEYGNY